MKKKVLSFLFAMLIATAAVGAFGMQTNKAHAAVGDVVNQPVATYTFADANDLGKDTSENGNHLTAIGNPVQDTVNGGVKFDGNSALYAAGDAEGFDFADYLVAEDFTLSITFMLSSEIPEGHVMKARNSVFTLWGYQYNEVNDYNVGGSADARASGVFYDSYANGASIVNLRFGFYTGAGYSSYWEGTECQFFTNKWITYTFDWNALTRTATQSYGYAGSDPVAKVVEVAGADHGFVSKNARFTIGNYYNDPAYKGPGLKYEGVKESIGLVGSVKELTITKQVIEGNKYNKLASYDFADANNYGKASNTAFDLEAKVGTHEKAGISYDSEKKAIHLNNAILAGKTDAAGYDFMDYMAGEDFTISTEFMLPKNPTTGIGEGGRGALLSLWGLWWDGSANNNSQGGDADLQSSSIIYDGYSAGAQKANIRIGFLYGEPGATTNGWWSGYEGQVTTDEFHKLAISVKGLEIAVYIDGSLFAKYTCATNNQWKNIYNGFAIGGVYGLGQVSGHSGDSYFKHFDIYDFAMSENEMTRLHTGKLDVVSAPYIASADAVESTVMVDADADDAAIMAAAPAMSEVKVALSDGTETMAKVLWTSVERVGTEAHLVGTIMAAGASNVIGVKAYMPVQFGTIEAVPAFVEYEFEDAENAGKSSKGGMFDLVKGGDGTVTVADGAVALDHSTLTAQNAANGRDFMDYMAGSDFTIGLQFKLPKGIEQGHVHILSLFNAGGPNKDTAVLLANNYTANATSTTLRIGFAYASTESFDGGSPENPYANAAYWSKYNKAIVLDVWNTIAFAYQAEGRIITVYINGEELCSYEVAAEAEWVTDWAMTLGAAGGNTNFKSLRIYDYAASNENLAKLSKHGVMPVGADAEVSAKKAVSASEVNVTLEQSELTAEEALTAVQAANRQVKVDLADGDMFRCNAVWDAVTANDDGSYTVTGTVIGVHNPDGIKATATVKLATATLTFDAEGATVKVGEEAKESATVTYGGAVAFTVEVAEGRELVAVKLGDTELVAVEGVYTIENITADATVTVETKEEEIVVPPSSEPVTSEPVTSEPATSEPATSEPEQVASSCNGSIGVGSFLAVLPMLFVAFALRNKKED